MPSSISTDFSSLSVECNRCPLVATRNDASTPSTIDSIILYLGWQPVHSWSRKRWLGNHRLGIWTAVDGNDDLTCSLHPHIIYHSELRLVTCCIYGLSPWRMASVGLMHNLSKMMVIPYLSWRCQTQLEMPAECACMRTRHTPNTAYISSWMYLYFRIKLLAISIST